MTNPDVSAVAGAKPIASATTPTATFSPATPTSAHSIAESFARAPEPPARSDPNPPTGNVARPPGRVTGGPSASDRSMGRSTGRTPRRVAFHDEHAEASHDAIHGHPRGRRRRA